MDQPPPILETPPTAPLKGPAMSLPARLMNIFAVPGDVFEEIKAAPHAAANWLAPALITALVGAIAAVIVLSQPAIQQKIRDQQDQAIEKKVQAGELTRAKADEIEAMIQKFSGPTVLKVTGAFSAVAGAFVLVFWWALVLWLLGLWVLKVRIDYLKAAEIAGLAGMIGVLGKIVELLLKVNLSNPASSPSLALALKSFDPGNPLHLLLAAVNLFELWQFAVMALGLARVGGVPFGRAAFAVFGYWVLMSFAWIGISAALVRLAGHG